MNLFDSLFQRFWQARTRDAWDRLSLVAVMVSAVATLGATGFAALSARASLDAVSETRALRNPVFVVESRDEVILVQFRNDEGFRSIPIAEGGPVMSESSPKLRITNYGSAPAINVNIAYLWLDSKLARVVPQAYSREIVRGLPRIANSGDQIYSTLEGGTGLAALAPVSDRGLTAIGSIGPASTKEVGLPPAVTYALFPFMLNDAIRSDERERSYLARRMMPPRETLTHHDLQVDISSDSIAGRRFSQRFIVRFTVAYATDRKANIGGSQFGKNTLARIEANDRIEVARTTFPSSSR